MIKKPIVVLPAGFVTLTVVVALNSSHKGDQRRPPAPETQTNKTPNLDTVPPKFPER